MPDFQAFHAKVKVDGIELPEYDVQIDLDRKCVSCWVPSEAGKVNVAMVVIQCSLNI